jgi:chromosome segregation ATPase
MTRIVLTRTIVAGMLCTIVIAAGCTTTQGRGEAKEATRAVTSLQETRAELLRADQQVNDTVTAMNQLASASPDLPQAYKVFTAEVSQASTQAQTAQRRAEQMQVHWQQYIAAWEKEIDRLSIPELQAGAAQRRQTVRANYDRLRDAARDMEAAYPPFLTQLRDLRKALSLDLTPAGVQAAQPAFTVARRSAADVRERINTFLSEIDRVSAASPGQPVGTAAAR